MPYETIATIDASEEIPEPEEYIRKELPDDRRLVSVYPDDEPRIEGDFGNQGWVRLGEITCDGMFEEAEYLADQLGSDFRVVSDWNAGMYIETYVEGE